MFKIKKDTFYVTRGDKGVFDLSLDDYTFKVEDVIHFKIYEAQGLNKPPVKDIVIEVKEEQDVLEVEFTSENTRFGEMLNEEKEYWYEIELNGNQTPYCFDEKGPKMFLLYPEGADSDVEGETNS